MGNTPLLLACMHWGRLGTEQGHEDVAPTCKVLIEAGADVNACNHQHTALMLSTYNSDLNTVKLLLEAGADPLKTVEHSHYTGGNALDLAIAKGNIEILNLFLATGLELPKGVCVCVYVCVCMCVYVYVCMYVCIYVCMYMCMYVC